MVDSSQSLDPYVLKARFSITEEELERLSSFDDQTKKHSDSFFDDLFKWMPCLHEYKYILNDKQALSELKTQHYAYWSYFFRAKVDQEYINNRFSIGHAHADSNLPLNTFCLTINFALDWWVNRLEKLLSSDSCDIHLISRIFYKLSCMDIALITDSYCRTVKKNSKAYVDSVNLVLEKAGRITESLAVGDFSTEWNDGPGQNSRLSITLNQLAQNLKKAVKHTVVLAQGRYEEDFVPIGDGDELGNAISELTLTLREMAVENKKSAWIKTGQAELSNIIRGDQNLEELGKNVISFLVKYLGAMTGTIYQIDTDQDETLQMIGSYAYHGEQGKAAVKFGEGLVGQCVLEKEMIVFSDVPEDYAIIHSSLGETAPKHIIVVPLLIDREVIGVVELGSLVYFDNARRELLRQVCENIAKSIKSVKNSEKMKWLLDDTKSHANL